MMNLKTFLAIEKFAQWAIFKKNIKNNLFLGKKWPYNDQIYQNS